jgi:hypothetical protein
VAKEISTLMSQRTENFNIITHSLGAYVAYLAMGYHDFPSGKMLNLFNLAAPLEQAPQQVSPDLEQTLQSIRENYDHEKFSNVAQFNFNGGLRDTLI